MAAMKKKPDLAVVIGMGKPKGEKEAPEEEHDEDGAEDEAAYHDAFHELAGALGIDPKSTDPARGAEAFKVLHDLCADEYGEEDGGGEEYEEEK